MPKTGHPLMEFTINAPNEHYDAVWFKITLLPRQAQIIGPWHQLHRLLNEFQPENTREEQALNLIHNMLDKFYQKHNLTPAGFPKPV